MQTWQLTLIILAAVVAGAAIPLLFLLASAVLRAGREITALGAQLGHTLTQVDLISVRVEKFSRGLEGGETSVAEMLTAVGALSRSLDRNMKIINVLSTILASVGTAAAAYVQTRASAAPDAPPPAPEEEHGPARDASTAEPARATHLAQDARQ